MILVVCKNIELMKKFMLANKVVDILHIALPALLILLGIIKFLKTFKNMDERIVKDGRKKVIRNILFAILIFFSPNILDYTNELIYNGQESIIACFREATMESIQASLKQYNEENNKLLIATIEKVKTNFDIEDYEKAFEILEKIPDSSEKENTKEELGTIKHYVEIKTEIRELEEKFNNAKYRKVYAEINELDVEVYKEILMNFLLELEAGTPLDISSGFSTKEYKNMIYDEIITETPTTNMPLIIYLHDDEFPSNNSVTSYFKNGRYTGEGFIYIAPHPKDYDSGKTWDDSSVRQDLKALIDKVVDEYEIDTKKIIITGYGKGALGTWNMVSEYPDFFSSAVPVSSHASVFKAESFKSTAVWAFAGDAEDEIENVEIMQKYVDDINSAGGNAIFTKSIGKTYAKMSKAFANKDVVDWALGNKKKTS